MGARGPINVLPDNLGYPLILMKSPKRILKGISPMPINLLFPAAGLLFFLPAAPFFSDP
jgi:hypothetical protein